MSDEVELFAELCDVLERDYHERHPGHEGAPANGDGHLHTSAEARRLAGKILDRLRDRGFLIGDDPNV